MKSLNTTYKNKSLAAFFALAIGSFLIFSQITGAQSAFDGFDSNAKTSRMLAPQVIDFTSGQSAVSVLGQTNFTTNTAGTTASKFNSASSVIVDPVSGKAFVADESSRILRFSSTAALMTGAAAEAVFGQADFTTGTSGIAANKLAFARGLSIDAAGRLWVGDGSNSRVLRFDNAATKATGANADGVLGQPNFTTSSAGTTQNKMNQPQGIFADSSGRLWVADTTNHRVLRFDNAAAKANGANADAVLGQPDFTTGSLGTTASKMNSPYGVLLDAGGRLYVAEGNNNRVTRFDAAATKANGAAANGVLGQPDFTTGTSGTSAIKMNDPAGLTTDSNGRLYVSDFLNNRVIIFNNAATLTNGAAANVVLGQPNFTTGTANTGGVSASSIYFPYRPFFDEASGSLFVAEFGNNRVLRFTPAPPSAASVSVAGRVLTTDGRGLANAIVTLTDSQGETKTARTSAFGFYHFDDVGAGETYVISVQSKRFSFVPQVINVFEVIENLDFTAQ